MESGETQRQKKLEECERARLVEENEERHRQRLIRERELLQAIKANFEAIETLVAKFAGLEELAVYKYYSQSFKVFYLQSTIEQAQALFDRLAPQGTGLNDWFLSICAAALEHKFNLLDRTFDWDRMNQDWHAWTRPILEAFWHCSFFLRMMARFGRGLEEPPRAWNPAAPDTPSTPAGWLGVLSLYGLAS